MNLTGGDGGGRAVPGPSAPAATVAAAIAAAFVVLQLSLIPALFPAGPISVATPLLPVALVAAWGAARDPVEAIPATLVAAAALGAVSSERVGWFILALLPTTAAAVTARALLKRAPWTRSRMTFGGAHASETTFPDAVLCAAGAATVGAAAYLALLTLAAGRASLLPELLESIAGSAGWSAVLAAVLAPLLRPLRRQRRGLFD